MEVTGKYNPKSTPETRIADRNAAEALGTIERIFTSQPFLIAYAVAAFVFAGWVEGSVHF
jgi:hypothetical protein